MIESTTGLATPVTVGPQTPLSDLTIADDLGIPEANELDREAFLKLLVAQLRYQDPLDPNDPADFMATTAQFTTIEKLEELTEQGANNAIVTGLSMASSLVGRTIAYVGIDDVARTGVVSSAAVVGGQVRLQTADGPVSLTDVTAIGSAADGLLDLVDTETHDHPDPVVPDGHDHIHDPAPTGATEPTSLTEGTQPTDPTGLVADEPAAARATQEDEA